MHFAAGQPALKPPAAGHDEAVKAVVRDYTLRHGQKYGLLPYRDTPRRPVDEALSRRTADAFHAAPHAPHDPETKKAYTQLMGEIKAQFDHIASHGVRMEPWLAKGQPYKDSSEMFADVRSNRHLWFFPTINPHELASFGSPGSDLDPHTNPLVEKSGHVVNGHPLTYNDLLRAVHDYAAHASVGNTFGPVGEYNAWAEHAKMFSPLAIKALTTETHGQNSWVNFGPHIRRADGSIPKAGDPDFIPQTKRPFADQKVFILPPDAIPPHPYPELDHLIHGRGTGPERLARGVSLAEAVRPARREDLAGDAIHLWHGTRLASVPGIVKRGLREGPRGKNAASRASDAAQYPEDTGAEALVLLRAHPSDLAIDPNDQIGETVEDGLFSQRHASSATVHKSTPLAAFDIENAARPDAAIAALDAGDLAGAIGHGARIIYQHPSVSRPEQLGRYPGVPVFPLSPYVEYRAELEAMRAPAGGMVTRGIYEPGGRFLPPEATGQRPNVSRVRALVRRLLSRRKRVTSGVVPGTSPGASYPQT